MADFQQGQVVTVAADVIVNGEPAFARGEQVTIGQVAPNPQRPEYKYTVYSARMSQWFQLRDADLMAQGAAYAQGPGPAAQQAPGAGAGRAGGGFDLSAMGTSDWLVGIGGLVMFIGTFFYFYGFGLLFPLMGIALIALVIVDKIAGVPAVSQWPGLTWVYIAIGAVATLLSLYTLLRLLWWLHGISIPMRWYITPVLELLASVAVLAGGIMRQREGL